MILPKGSLFQNAVLNGRFDVWQRNAATTTNTGYSADRWKLIFDVTAAEATVVSDSDVLSNNCLRLKQTTKGAGTFTLIRQVFESANSAPFRGKTVTFSCWLKRNSSLDAGNITLWCVTGTGTDESAVTTGGISYTTIIPYAQVLTSGYTKFTLTFAVPANTNQMETSIYYNGVSNGAELYIKQVQLNEGSFALPFVSRCYGEEMELCQRYFQKFGLESASNQCLGAGLWTTTTVANIFVPLIAEMRITPTLDASTGQTDLGIQHGASFWQCSALSINANNSGRTKLMLAATQATGTATVGYGALLHGWNANKFLAVTSEL